MFSAGPEGEAGNPVSAGDVAVAAARHCATYAFSVVVLSFAALIARHSSWHAAAGRWVSVLFVRLRPPLGIQQRMLFPLWSSDLPP